MISIERITNNIDREVNRLANGPAFKDMMRFERVLIRQFAATQAKVHVITGSLKSSGRVASSHGSDKWEGEITYGGRSAGIHNPVDYAEFERERDQSHDFLAPAEKMEHLYIHAMNEFFGG
jgi:hypothetical protein